MVAPRAVLAQEDEKTFPRLGAIHLPSSPGVFLQVAVGPDMRLVATLIGRGPHDEEDVRPAVRVFRWRSRTLCALIRPAVADAFAVAFHPHGRTLAVAGPRGVSLYEASSGRLMRVIRARLVRVTPVFSPDGRVLACAGGSEVLFFETGPRGRLVSRLDSGPGTRVESLAWSRQGRTVAVAAATGLPRAGYSPSVIKVWRLGTRARLVASVRSKDEVIRLVFGVGDRTLVTSGPGGLQVRDSRTLHPRVLATRGPCSALAVAARSGLAAVIPIMETYAEIVDLASGRALGRTLRAGEHAEDVAISPDGRTLVLAVGRTLGFYDLTRPRSLEAGEP